METPVERKTKLTANLTNHRNLALDGLPTHVGRERFLHDMLEKYYQRILGYKTEEAYRISRLDEDGSRTCKFAN